MRWSASTSASGRPPVGALTCRRRRLIEGELRILARETRPRGTVNEVVTYPGDCGVLNRDALPAGELAVRADDTISDEFIVGGDVTVPDRNRGRRIASI